MNLKRKYRIFNKRYFRGSLPDDMIVEWSDKLAKKHMAGTHIHGLRGLKCPGGKKRCRGNYIRISPELKGLPTVAELTLLHEMVHAKSHRGDLRYCECGRSGRAFQREMKRLALAGAFNELW